MTGDPDHLDVVELSLHVVECTPVGMPYERYGVRHREQHRRLAHQLLAGLQNAGYTLTSTPTNQEEHQ